VSVPEREDHPNGDFVRPFIMTGGRTPAAEGSLRIETLVETNPLAGLTLLNFERRSIVELCTTPNSIAEISALLSLPLGVVMVLVADLIDDGALQVHHTDPVDIELSTLRRMIERVRAI
jgi:uncharacterized protein DUF742